MILLGWFKFNYNVIIFLLKCDFLDCNKFNFGRGKIF